jgi:hypothetical protein
MVSSSTRAVDVNMLNMNEEVSDLVQQANKLVCKEGRFTLNASANASDQVDKRTLVRKVVADKVLNKNKVMVITTKAWVPTEGMSVKVVGENLFLFVFNAEADKKRVECQAPWNIDGYHLILKKPTKNQLPREINFSTTNFWVQAHNLPLEYISKENAIIIGNSMGKFMEADLAGVENAK